jgi:hypothetical protein
MLDNITLLDLVKTVGSFATGGLAGAYATHQFTKKRGKVQPVNFRLSVSFVDIPQVIPGYSSMITVSGSTAGTSGTATAHHFQHLAIIQLELTNSGNADIPTFNLGINLPEGNGIISVQYQSPDRYHIAKYSPEVSPVSYSDQLDFVLEPFNRADTYSLTMVANSFDKDLGKKIKLSKKQSVKFVDASLIDKLKSETADLLVASIVDMPFGGNPFSSARRR